MNAWQKLLGLVIFGTKADGTPDRVKTDDEGRAQVLAKQGAAGTARWPVKDAFSAIEHEADQTGAGAVLNFPQDAAGDFVMVDVDNVSSADNTVYRARATLDGSTPSATTGFVCRSGQTSYLPFPMTGTVVKVFAPTGVVVAVQAGRY